MKKRMKSFWCLLSVVGSAALVAAGPINNKPSHVNETANPPAHHRSSLAPSMISSEMNAVIDPLKTSNSSNHSEINVNHTLVPSTHFHESPSQSPVLPNKNPINHSNETNDSYVETGKNETNLMTRNCTDQNEPFALGNGSAPIENCKWISEHSKAQRCKRPEVAKRCPFTCGLCTRTPDKPHHPTMYPSIVPLDPHHTMSPSQGKDMDEHDGKDCGHFPWGRRIKQHHLQVGIQKEQGE